jgi:hypothetical protein
LEKTMKNLTAQLRFFALPSLILLAWTAAHAQLTPSADAYTNTASPTTNFGTAATLNVKSASQTAYIQFDLSAIPSGYTGANVAQASLKLYVNAVTNAGSFNIDYVDGAWSEKTITADLSPALGTTIVSDVSLAKTQAGDYIVINITSAVAAWLNGSQANDGIALVANSPLNCSFDSKENTGTGHSPELDIVFLGNGAQGPAGPQGPEGPQGLQGVSGPMGPLGPQGPEGPAGINNRGTWVSTTAYQINDSISYQGSSWIALIANTDSAPATSNPNWQLLAAKGINNQGSWVSSVNYQVDDAVTDGGQFWIAVAPSLDSEPSILNPNWQLVAASGAPGPAGPAGPQGVVGPTGSTGPQGQQGATGAPGATGPQGPTGSTGATGPQGPLGPIGAMGLTGAQGPQGLQGPAGTNGTGFNFRNAFDPTATYAVNDVVTYSGSTYVAIATNGPGSQTPDQNSSAWSVMAQQGAIGQTGAQGAQGATGPQGPIGLTGAAGSQGATGAVGPMGPQGLTGATGAQGPQGPAGPIGVTTGVMNAALLRWYSQTYGLTGYPDAVAFDGTNIWVASQESPGTVTELTASTGAVVGTYTVGTYPIAMAFDGTNIWVANSGSNNVTELAASTGAVVGTYTVGNTPYAVAFDGTNIWVTNSGSSNVTKLLASTGAVVGTYSVGSDPQGLAFDGTNIWVANYGSNNVTKLSASSGGVVGTYTVGSAPLGVAFDGANIWVANAGGPSVTKLLASTGAVVGTYSVAGVSALAFDGTNIWTTFPGGKVAIKIIASSGAVAATYPVGSTPQGLAFDGTNIWVANAGGPSVTKIPIN